MHAITASGLAPTARPSSQCQARDGSMLSLLTAYGVDGMDRMGCGRVARADANCFFVSRLLGSLMFSRVWSGCVGWFCLTSGSRSAICPGGVHVRTSSFHHRCIRVHTSKSSRVPYSLQYVQSQVCTSTRTVEGVEREEGKGLALR